MSTSHIHPQAREPEMHRFHNAGRLGEHILRALNKIRKPGTAEEITELLNRDLEPGDRPFQAREVAAWLRSTEEKVLSLYWLESRPRK